MDFFQELLTRSFGLLHIVSELMHNLYLFQIQWKKKPGKHERPSVKPKRSVVFLTRRVLCLNDPALVANTEHTSMKDTTAFLTFFGRAVTKTKMVKDCIMILEERRA